MASNHEADQSGGAEDDGLPILAFVARNHDTIEAIAAVLAVGAAVWLAVVTGMLHKATRDLATSTEDLAKGAEHQVSEMGKARELAERQHDLAERQFLLAAKQADLAEKEFQLQRFQYLAEHRPIIGIRGVGIVRAKGNFPFEEGAPIIMQLVIFNSGACDAVIVEAQYRFFISHDGLPMVPPFEPSKMRSLISEFPFTLLGHGSHLVEIEGAMMGRIAESIVRGTEQFYLIGAIRYHGGTYRISDDSMDESYMGFGRVYVPPAVMGGDGHFEPVDNPSYEYSD